MVLGTVCKYLLGISKIWDKWYLVLCVSIYLGLVRLDKWYLVLCVSIYLVLVRLDKWYLVLCVSIYLGLVRYGINGTWYCV